MILNEISLALLSNKKFFQKFFFIQQFQKATAGETESIRLTTQHRPYSRSYHQMGQNTLLQYVTHTHQQNEHQSQKLINIFWMVQTHQMK